MSIPGPGDLAPDIELPDEAGAIHRLAGQRGRWTIVYFYPKDDTPGCTLESCQLRDAHPDFLASGADVWGISPDGAESHRRFREKYDLPFALLSDEDHAVAERYGAWQLKSMYGREYMGIQRSTFLVGPDGRIARTWPKVTVNGHAAEVLEVLAGRRAAAGVAGPGRPGHG